MELLHLKYFKAVAEEESVTAAAKKLYVSQPYLSTKIHELEEELGIQLFERRNRHIYLSEAGRIFLEHVKRADQEIETAMYHLNMLKRQNNSYEKMIVGASSCGLIQPIILKFNREVGRIAVSHLVESNSTIFEQLLQDRMEFGITCVEPDDHAIDFAPIFVEELVVVMRKNMHPSMQNECGIDQLRHNKVMVCTMMTDKDFLCSVCQKAGFTPDIDFITNEVPPEDSTFDDHILYVPLHNIEPMAPQIQQQNLKVVHIRDYFAVMTWGLAFKKSTVFTQDKLAFFKAVDAELRKQGDLLATKYGEVKNYSIHKRDVQRDFT